MPSRPITLVCVASAAGLIAGTVPAIKPAALATKTGTIGLLGTGATVRQPYVDRLEAEFAQGKRLIRHAADALVPLAEAKMRGDTLPPNAVAHAVAGLRDHPGAGDLDTLVLACTHFPLLGDELRGVFGAEVALVDGAQGIARRIVSLLQGQDFDASAASCAVTTGEAEAPAALVPVFDRHGLMRHTQF